MSEKKPIAERHADALHRITYLEQAVTEFESMYDSMKVHAAAETARADRLAAENEQLRKLIPEGCGSVEDITDAEIKARDDLACMWKRNCAEAEDKASRLEGVRWHDGLPPLDVVIIAQVDVLHRDHGKRTDTYLGAIDNTGMLTNAEGDDDFGWEAEHIARWVPLDDILEALDGTDGGDDGSVNKH